jgi:hypothetical protein
MIPDSLPTSRLDLPRSVCLFAALGFGATLFLGPAHGQCIDYGDYMHWAGDLGFGSDDVCVVGNMAYFAREDYYGNLFVVELQTVDISDPTYPSVIGSCTWEIFGGSLCRCPPGVSVVRPASVAVAGNLAFVTATLICYSDPPGCVDNGWSALCIFDISNPASPQVIASLTSDSSHFWDVAAEGHYAYLASTGLSSCIQVLTVSKPSSPSVVATLGGTCTSVKVEGDHLYAARAWEIQAIDIGDPTTPSVAGRVYVGSMGDLSLAGEYAYLAGEDLLVVNISNPASPWIVSLRSGRKLSQRS